MSHGTRLLWLWRRLRVMPPAEIAHRLGEALRTRLPDARRYRPQALGAEALLAELSAPAGAPERNTP